MDPLPPIPICARCGPTSTWRDGPLLTLRCSRCGGRLQGLRYDYPRPPPAIGDPRDGFARGWAFAVYRRRP